MPRMLGNCDGVGLVESLVSMGIAAAGLLAVAGLMAVGAQQMASSRDGGMASMAATSRLERLRMLPQVAAARQLDVAGTPTINGQLVAANRDDDPYPGPATNPNHNPVRFSNTGRMALTGNPRVNYNGSGMQSVQPVSWRECRGEWVGAAPGSPCGNP